MCRNLLRHNPQSGHGMLDRMACHERAKRVEWRRGESNPKILQTQDLQNNNTSSTEHNETPSDDVSKEQLLALPKQLPGTSGHDLGAHLVREESWPSDLASLIVQVEAASLPDDVKQTINNLIRQHGGDHE